MGIQILPALKAGAGTAIASVGEQIQASANKQTGLIPMPPMAPVPAGTTPAASVSSAPPTGGNAAAPTPFTLPIWVYVVGGLAVVVLVWGIVKATKKGA